MKIIAFVGPSGTGKSYRALWVAKQKNIDYIIDDGLLIGNNKVIAGFSAKKEQTKVAAIRRACFFDKKHTSEVKEAIKEHNPKSILIIATSTDMAKLIAKSLQLGEIQETVNINDVASKEEIKKALEIRGIEGKHVIPVPTFELKKTFSGYFMDAIKTLRPKEDANYSAEKTIVRPSYSYLGKYIISETVIKDIAKHAALNISPQIKLNSIDVVINDGNVNLNMQIVVNYTILEKDLFHKIQGAVVEEIEKLTCMNVAKANILLKTIKV